MAEQNFSSVQKRTRRAMNKLASALINMQPFLNSSKDIQKERWTDIVIGLVNLENNLDNLRTWLEEKRI
jgi:hypothetical protein